MISPAARPKPLAVTCEEGEAVTDDRETDAADADMTTAKKITSTTKTDRRAETILFLQVARNSAIEAVYSKKE